MFGLAELGLTGAAFRCAAHRARPLARPTLPQCTRSASRRRMSSQRLEYGDSETEQQQQLVRAVSDQSREGEQPLRLARLRSGSATPRPADAAAAGWPSGPSAPAANGSGHPPKKRARVSAGTPAPAAAAAANVRSGGNERTTTPLDAAARRLFGLRDPGTFGEHMARIRQLLGRPSFWHTPAVDTITERLGKGTYGTVYRGTLASGRGDVAIKQIPIKSEGVLTDAAREFLVQQVVYDCYERSATRECWAPVHHPFPTLYGVTGHLAAGSGYVMRASMFLFQRANHHRRALFEILLQVAAVLCHLNTASGLRFMHRDLHWNNVMRRTNSKQVKLALFRGAKGSCPDTLSHSNSDSGCVLTL